jgi:tetratricopeptide (TPR) repeat protein
MSKVTQWLIAVARACAHVPSWMVVKKERMAMGMAIVAVFGAAAAFCAARSELTSSRLESKLHQGQMLGLTIRQKILDDFAENGRLRDRQKQHDNLVKARQQDAQFDPANAGTHEFRAQEEFAVADTLNSFIRFTEVGIKRNLTPRETDQHVDKLVSAELRHLGFDVVWDRNASIWEKLETQIRNAQELVKRLAVSVMVFVLALVFFTLAQLSHTRESDAGQLSFSFIRRRHWKLWLTCVGCLIAVGGLLSAGWHDPEAWKTFGKFAAGILAVMGLGRVLSATYADWEFLRNSERFGALLLWLENPNRLSSVLLKIVRQAAQWLRNYLLLEETAAEEEPGELEELEPPKSPGLRIPMIPAAHRLGRIVIILIAITAFASAISGLLYSTIIIESDRAAASALNYQVDRFKTSSLNRMETYDQLNRLADGQECLTRLWADQQRVELAKPKFERPKGVTVTETLLDTLNRVTVTEKCLDKVSGVTVALKFLDMLNSDQGPDSDARFPEQLLQPNLTSDSEILFAKGDGENEISLAWRNRAIGFLRSLTLFAIALYLFGQSLGLGRTRAAFMLSLYALALAVFGITSPFKGWRDNSPPFEPDVLEAATYYGAGRTLYDTSSFDGAAKKFQDAVKRRPTFALAKYYLAKSITPQQQGYISQISKRSLPQIVSLRASAFDALTKQELLAPVEVLGDYGFENVLLGFCQRDPILGHKCIDSGLKEINQAIHRMKDDAGQSTAKREDDNDYPYLQFNLALALLADGQREDADEAYRQGTMTLQRLAETDAAGAEQFVSGAISDLNTLERYCNRVHFESYCSGVRDDIALRKKELIAAVWGRPDASNKAEISPSDVDLIANAAGLGWSARLSNVNLRRHVLDVIWYECDTASDDPQGCDEELTDTSTSDDHWKAWWVLPKLSKRATNDHDFAYYTNSINIPDCLQPGRYLAEFYMDDKPPLRLPVDLRGTGLQAVNSRNLNMSMCHPGTWIPWKSSGYSNTSTSLVKGYTSRDATGDRPPSRGAFLFKYYYPMQNGDANVKSALSRAQNLLVSEKLISNFEPQPIRDGCKNLPEEEGTFRARFDHDGDMLLSKAWVQKDGVVHVALVFHRLLDTDGNQNHPSSSIPDEDDCDILSSARNMY